MKEKQIKLFDLPKESKRQQYLKRLRHPIWTENKAKLIARYLYYFVLVTKHGTYIDGFAGPQEPDKPETWAAKLAIEFEPRRLRHFYLFDNDQIKYEHLVALKESQNNEPDRDIQVYFGDFNELVHAFLDDRPIKEREASFCLLDQHTFECHWSTLQAVATYKKTGLKIELFYFLPALWLDRAMAAQKDKSVLTAWWGRDDYDELRGMRADNRALLFCERFKEEFKYLSVLHWPIYGRKDGGRIMYHMVHATDHQEAPNLMYRAYHQAVIQKETPEQFEFEFVQWKSGT
jgi:three-Cys-motif partner protein